MRTNAFKTASENAAQFNGLISILLVLFSGIVLRWNELSKISGGDDGDYNTIMVSGILIISQVAVMGMFLAKMVQPGKKANGKERIKQRIFDSLSNAAVDELFEHLEEVVDGMESAVHRMVEKEQLSHATGELAQVLLNTCRNSVTDDGKKETIIGKLSSILAEQMEKMDMALFDLAVDVCGDEGLLALHKVAIQQGTELLEDAAAPPLCIHMAVTAIKMGPRVMSSFEIVSSHLQGLATKCCSGEDVLDVVLELILQIGGGARGLQRIVDESFRLLRDDLLVKGVSKLALCLLMPMSKAAVPALFHELSNAEEDESSSSDEDKEDKIDFCTLVLKMSGLTSMDDCFDMLVFLAKACLGTAKVDHLMEVSCIKMAQKACYGRDSKVCNAINGAAKVACSNSTSHIRFSLQLSSLTASSPSQKLMDLAAEQLTAKGLEQVTDSRLVQACNALMTKLDDETNFNTLDKALGETIVQDAGGIVVQHGLSVFCNWCALFQSAEGKLLDSLVAD